MPRKIHGIQIKRVYDEPSPGDGARFLVDRIWPRGIKRSALSSITWRLTEPFPHLDEVRPGLGSRP